MKSEKGVTISSIIIYVVALTIVVGTMSRITTFFYKNIKSVDNDASADFEYTKFNSYFTNEINIEGNDVILFSNTAEESYIVFSKTKNQYTFKGDSIYKGKVKINQNIQSCNFNYDYITEEITVNLTILGKDYKNTYTVEK